MNKSKGTERRDVYEIVTAQILEQLEAGTVPWHQPWRASAGLPMSMSTRKEYRGINPFLLAITANAKGYSSPFWGTYKVISELGGQVRKGEKSTLVVFWKTYNKTETDDQGDERESKRFVLRYFSVFNAEQADGLPAWCHPALEEISNDVQPIEACESIVSGYVGRPMIQHRGAQASYSPHHDVVTMPARETFKTAEGYYSTLFHELGHSTGHAKRLARPTLMEFHRFGDESYSKEELVAEMGAAMLCGLAGIEQTTVPMSAAYVASWLKVLRGDSKLVVQAAAQAQRAADLIAGTQAQEVAA